jgi:hypothetical protein
MNVAAAAGKKCVLMIAYHFPPFGGSSGSRRTLAFSRFLPEFGWHPIVLTVTAGAYDTVRESEMALVPPGLPVVRALALDAARHFSIRGRYPTRLALPDRWRSWQPFAVRAAMKIIRRHRPSVIWSTYPIASAHAIAARLAQRSGLPWVADMRDPMVELDPYSGIEYPRDPRVRQARLEVERQVVQHSTRVVFCTAGARRICAERYGLDAARRFTIISNGYDEQEFAQAEAGIEPLKEPAPQFRLIHSGTVYPGDDRGPGPLFGALAELRRLGKLPAGFRLILRATGYDAEVKALAIAAGVTDLVEIADALPYRAALQEMLQADGLLLLQGAASNPAIPAKLYEYLRAQRPILALVHPDGDSAALLKELDGAVLAPLDELSAITAALQDYFGRCRNNSAPLVPPDVTKRFSRRSQSAELAALLSDVIAGS